MMCLFSRCSYNSEEFSVVCNINHTPLLVSAGRSFKCMAKNKGPRTVPWGMPDVTGCSVEELWLNVTYCCVLSRINIRC